MKDKRMLVYALSHPVTGEIRYVGKSERGLERPRQHGTLSNLRKTHLPVVCWIKKLRSQDLDYVIEVVEEFPDRQSLMDGERFYIAYFRSLGFRLLNICDGGEGFTGRHTPETRAKIAAAGRGRKMSPEAIERGAAKRRERPLSPEHRAAMRVPKTGAGAKGVPKSREARARMSAAQMGKKPSPESVAKMARSKGAKPVMDEAGQVYATQSDAARAHGLDQGSVRSVLIGKSIHAKGHVFAYADAVPPGALPVRRPRLPNRGGRPRKSPSP